MTAFADYTDLRIAIAEQVGKRDISDVLDRMTKSAEAWFDRELRVLEQITEGILTFAGGVASLPNDFIEVATSPNNSEYTVRAGSLVVEGAEGMMDFAYYAKLPSLTANATPSNWLLQKCPDLYLSAVTLHVAKWLKDVELADAMGRLVAMEIDSLKWSDLRARYGASKIVTTAVGP